MNKRICVVGAGYWGKNHINTLDRLKSLGGIVDSNPSTLEFFSSKFKEVSLYNNLDETFNDNFDGYIVSSPAKTHYQLARKIILNKKPVLIEKPLTLRIDESEELLSLSKACEVFAMVGHVLLFHPAVKKIKQLIKSDAIGKLQYLYSNRLNLGKVRTEENVFWSLAPHDIAIFQYLTNSNPQKVHSNGSVFLQKDIPDSTITQLEYINGVKAHIFVSWLHPFKEHRLVVIGSKGMITLEDSIIGKPLKLYSKTFDFIDGVPEKIDGPVEIINYDSTLPLDKELEYFLKNLKNKTSTISGLDHGLGVMKTLVDAGEQLLD